MSLLSVSFARSDQNCFSIFYLQTYNTPEADVSAYLKDHQPESIRARYANHEALKEHPEVARFLEWDKMQKVGLCLFEKLAPQLHEDSSSTCDV